MPWKVDCEMDIRECSGERGGSRSGQREQSAFTVISAGALASSTRSLEVGWRFELSESRLEG